MKNKYNKRRYKLQAGVQYATIDTPDDKTDYSDAYKKQAENAARNKGILDASSALAGQYGSIAQVGGLAGDVVQSNIKDKKKGAITGGAIKYGAAGAAIGTAIMPGIGTAVGAGLGALAGGFLGNEDYQAQRRAAMRAEREANIRNYNRKFTPGSSTDAQSFLAKKGKYKVKTKAKGSEELIKDIRPIESEGREPVFGPKMKNGKRKLLFYNPDLPTHKEGGVPMLVVPKEMYNNGTNNLMPRRSKVSLLGSGNMAVGAKQLKVNDLNSAAFSQNLTGMPPANAANKFIQPTTGIHQVARQIPEERRKEKIRTPRSHKKENPDTNRIIDPPMLYEMKPPPPRSTFNTKNDFNKGSKRIKVYR